MHDESPLNAYRRAVRRFADSQATQDLKERNRRVLEHRGELEKAFRQLEEVADSDDPEVWEALADAYSKRWWAEKDTSKAILLLRRAANAGRLKSMVNLGHLLKQTSPAQNPVEAVTWYLRAAEGGDVSGMIFLGFAFRDGCGVSPDCEKAAEWFGKAVKAGDGHSMIHLGKTYRNFGDAEKAIHWFRRAAEAGYTESHIELAYLHDNPDSKFYNPQEAVRWYRLAEANSSGSNLSAKMALAKHIRNGTGAPKDPEAAKSLLLEIMDGAPTHAPIHQKAKRLLQKWNDSDAMAAQKREIRLNTRHIPSWLNRLAEEIQEEVARLRKAGSASFEKRDYDLAAEVIEFAKELQAFHIQVKSLEEEWRILEGMRGEPLTAPHDMTSKRFFGRERGAEITTLEEYSRPLLQAVVEMGGIAKAAAVIARVGEILKPVLKPKDYEKTATRAKELRWQNTTRWARQKMVEDGRLKPDSPKGIWEISAQGREWLKAR